MSGKNRKMRQFRGNAISMALCAAASFVPFTARAQSSVTLYGLIDAGIDYNTNVGGKHQVSMGTGILSPNLFGFRGKEDLGGGLSAIFLLEGQFNAGNDALIGNEFGRQAYVGLSDTKWGTLVAGNQYDFMFTSLAVKRYGPEFPFVSLQNLRQGPFNGLGVPNQPTGAFDFDRVAGERITNSVKYESPSFNGLSFGAMYGLGGVAGSFSQNSSQSFGIDYANGVFNLDAAYTYVKYPGINNGNSGIRNFGAGGGIVLGNAYLDALYTYTKNTFTGARVDVYELGGIYNFGGAFHLVGAYQFMDGNKVLNDNKAHQINLTLDYSLSKRTDVYTSVTYQHATGDGAQAQIILFGPSAGKNQMALRVGMRHVF
ncbi:Porin [Paraburkholderia kururiensis]|uniref:porin n=1 Tax=Paraburkholderia kururiensis TaxID=984307 RepID=UPI0039A65F26